MENHETSNSLSISHLAEIDRLCRAFERTLAADERPKIEDYLTQIPIQARSALFEELVKLEIKYLSKPGQILDSTDYQIRFPEYDSQIKQVWEDHVPQLGSTVESAISTPTPVLGRDRNPPAGEPTVATTATSHQHAAVGKVSDIGDYEIIEEIARGGMGVVYKARQKSLNRIVALKLILAGEFASESEIRRFYTEAESAAKLSHPGIVPVYEIGQFEGIHYFSMGFVEGGSLASCIKRQPATSEDTATIMHKVAVAVHYANERGVIHRDLKPGNILLDTHGEPRVTDFGLAKNVEADSELTATGQVVGTPSYMSPEQASGKKNEIDARSDVYSLGAVMYAVVTGQAPFRGTSVAELLSKVTNDEPISPRQLVGSLDRDLETIILKCLEKRPSLRYESASSLADDLQRYLSGEPILARSVGRSTRVIRWIRRNQVASLTLFFAAVVTIATPNLVLMFKSLQSQSLEVQESEKRALQKAEQASLRAKENRLAKLESDARLALERREWLEAVSLVDKALDEGHADPCGLQILKVIAFLHLGDKDDCMRLTEALKSRVEPGPHWAKVMLLYGDILLSGKGETSTATQMIRLAIEYKDYPLQPSDLAYANSLLADNPNAAIEYLRECLEQDPFHYLAHSELMMTLFLLYRFDESREMALIGNARYPRDSHFVTLLSIVSAAQGDLEAAQQTARQSKSMLNPEQYERLNALLSHYHEISRTMDTWDKKTGQLSPRSFIKLWEGLKSPVHFRIPPVLRDYFSSLNRVVMDSLAGRNDTAAKNLELLLETTPTSAGYFLLGEIYIGSRDSNRGRNSSLAEAAFLKAADLPGLPNTDREAFYAATMSAATTWVAEQNDEDLERAAGHALKRLELGPLRPPHDSYLFRVLMRNRDFVQARSIVSESLKRDSQDKQWLLEQVKLEIADQNFDDAVRVGESYVAQLGEDPEILEQIKEARAALDRRKLPINDQKLLQEIEKDVSNKLFAEAVKSCDELLAKHPSNLAIIELRENAVKGLQNVNK